MNNFKSMLKSAFNNFTGITILILAFCINVNGQSKLKKARPIIFSDCLNFPKTQPGFFKNKYIVLDFWATWCGPCIAAFPHLDSLSRKFSADSVVFAIISSEEKTKVSKFLQQRKINAYYLIDAITASSKASAKHNDLYGITAQNFNVTGLPHTVVIDKDNNIVFSSEVAGPLTDVTLSNILHNKGREVMGTIDSLNANKLLMQQERAKKFALIRKDTLFENGCRLVSAPLAYSAENMAAGYKEDQQIQFVEIEGRPIEFSYFYFTRLPYNRIKNKSALTSVYVNFEGPIDMPREKYWATALNLLSKARHVNFVKETREVDTYDLEIINEPLFKLKSKPLQDDSSDHVSNADNSDDLVYSNFTLEKIANSLEDYLGIPVLVSNEKFRDLLCDMIIKKGDITQLNNYLTSSYGIRLKSGKHRVEFINILPSS